MESIKKSCAFCVNRLGKSYRTFRYKNESGDIIRYNYVDCDLMGKSNVRGEYPVNINAAEVCENHVRRSNIEAYDALHCLEPEMTTEGFNNYLLVIDRCWI